VRQKVTTQPWGNFLFFDVQSHDALAAQFKKHKRVSVGFFLFEVKGVKHMVRQLRREFDKKPSTPSYAAPPYVAPPYAATPYAASPYAAPPYAALSYGTPPWPFIDLTHTHTALKNTHKHTHTRSIVKDIRKIMVYRSSSLLHFLPLRLCYSSSCGSVLLLPLCRCHRLLLLGLVCYCCCCLLQCVCVREKKMIYLKFVD